MPAFPLTLTALVTVLSAAELCCYCHSRN